MSDTKEIPVKMRTCNCIEVGIDTDTILFALMKMQDKRLASPNIVKECPHWEIGFAKLPTQSHYK